MKKQTLTAHPIVRTLFHEMDKQLYIYIYMLLFVFIYTMCICIPYIANRSHEPILHGEFIKHKNERVNIRLSNPSIQSEYTIEIKKITKEHYAMK